MSFYIVMVEAHGVKEEAGQGEKFIRVLCN